MEPHGVPLRLAHAIPVHAEPRHSHEKAFSKANTKLQEMVEFAIEAAKSGERIDVVERQLFSQLLGIGHTVLQAFVTGQGDGDAGPGIEQNGVALRRLKGRRQRR
jgi:hypothetical protein